jgi:hypothetical protein
MDTMVPFEARVANGARQIHIMFGMYRMCYAINTSDIRNSATCSMCTKINISVE